MMLLCVSQRVSIAAGAHFLVGSYGFENGPGGTNGTGMSCTTCDYNGITIDAHYGVNMSNMQRVGNNILGSTCTGGNKDEAWLLLDASNNIVDAVYYGNENNACGYQVNNISIPAFGALGAVVVNNAIAPHDGTSPIVTALTNITNTNNINWSYAGPRINGCNSSYQRIPDGGSFANGAVDNNALAIVGSYTSGAQPTAQPTNHPTPGNDNVSVPFTFDISGAGAPTIVGSAPTDVEQYIVCSATPITFEYVVNNYQNVQNMTSYANGKIGSYVQASGAGIMAPSPWTSIATSTPSAGQTTLTYTVTPPIGTTTYELVWEDFIVNCCGSSSYNVTSGKSKTSTAWECYERRKVEIVRVDAMTASKTSISCPTDFTPGTVNLSTLISGGYNISYELFANGVSQGVNTTGVFPLANALASPITATVTDGAGCSAPINITINDNCKAAPICPTLVLDAANSSASGTYCPGDTLDLCIDANASIDLPEGGVVSWYKGTTTTFDPFASPMSDLIDTAQIVVSSAAYTGSPVLNEVCYDPVNNDGSSPTGEWIEIACNPNTAIGCYILTDGDWVIQIPSATTCPASGFYVIGTSNSNQANPATSVAVDLDVNTCASCVVGGSGALVMTNSGEFVSLFDPSLTQVDNITFDGPSAGNSPGGSESFTYSAGCGVGSASVTHAQVATANDSGNGSSVARSTDGTGSWGGQSNPTAGATNGAAPATTVNCKQYVVSIDDCNNNGNLFFKAIVQPINIACSEADATSAAIGGITVVCPIATIAGTSTICNGTGTPSTTTLDITSSASLAGYIPWISVNGISSAFPALVGADPTYPITVSAAGSYEIDSLVPPSTASCIATIDSPNFAEVMESNPPLVIVQGGCTGALLDKPTVLISPQEAVVNPTFSITVPAGATPSSNMDGTFTLPAMYTGPITAQMILGSCMTMVSSTIGPCPPIPAVLPVTLVDFMATVMEQKVNLSWVVMDEKNFSHYEVECSANGADFSYLNTINATGQNTLRTNYNSWDNNPLKHKNYYRLKMVDLDGQYTYSEVLTINLAADRTEISNLYPNPAQDILNLSFVIAEDAAINIQMMDVSGKVLKTQTIHLNKGFKTIKLDVEHLAAGKYFISIPSLQEHSTYTFIKL